MVVTPKCYPQTPNIFNLFQTIFPNSLLPAGARGFNGLDGNQGATGSRGPRGERGFDGSIGATGAPGAPGGPVVLDNECEVNNGGCHDICVDTYDGYCCMCRPGYHLTPLENYDCAGRLWICLILTICNIVLLQYDVILIIHTDISL